MNCKFNFVEAVVDSKKSTEVQVQQARQDLLKYAPDKKGGSGRKRKMPTVSKQPAPISPQPLAHVPPRRGIISDSDSADSADSE